MVRAKYHRGCHRPQRWVFGVRSREAPWLHSARTSAWHPNAVANHPARHRFRHQCGPTNGVHMPNWRHSAMFTKRWTIAGISWTQLRAYAPTMSRHTGAPSSDGSRRWSAPRPGLCHPTWMSTWRGRYSRTSSLAFVNMQHHIAERYPLQWHHHCHQVASNNRSFSGPPTFYWRNAFTCRLHVHVYYCCLHYAYLYCFRCIICTFLLLTSFFRVVTAVSFILPIHLQQPVLFRTTNWRNAYPCRLHVHVYCLCFIASLTLIARINASAHHYRLSSVRVVTAAADRPAAGVSCRQPVRPLTAGHWSPVSRVPGTNR